MRLLQHSLSCYLSSSTSVLDKDEEDNSVVPRCDRKRHTCTTSEDSVLLLELPSRDPVADAQQWMHTHAQRMTSVTSTGVMLDENFAQFLILELTGDQSLVDIALPTGPCNFFKHGGVLTTFDFPDDLDTTSIAYTVLNHFTPEVKNEIMDEMLSFRDEHGIIRVYFDRRRLRIDPVVCVNVLTFFYRNGRGAELAESLDWVHHTLESRTYEHGTLYYDGGDCFLYFLSRLVSTSSTIFERLDSLFAERIQERFGAPGDALALAMRVLAAASLGVRDTRDYERLLTMQHRDGSWPLGWMYKYASTGIQIGNQGLTTAMASAAVRTYRTL